MRVLSFFIFVIVLLSSCSFELWQTVEVRITEPHPFEESSGRHLWYELRYFNGKEVVERHLAPGTKRIKVRVLAGSSCPIVVIPLGLLSPLGGIFCPGDSMVSLNSNDGQFMSLLINAASYRPKAVSELSVQWLRKIGDLSILDQEVFLEDLYCGSLSYDSLKYSKIYHITLDILPSGYWISDSTRAKSFVIRGSGDSISLNLFSGSYCFWNRERSLLATVVIDEEGHFYMDMMSLSSAWL